MIAPTHQAARDRWALVVALLLPTLITLLYFVWMAKAAAFIYGPLKLLQFAFPAVWVFVMQRGQRKTWPAPQYARSVMLGLLFGFAVFGAGLALYFAVLKPSDFFAGSIDEIHAKVKDMGLNSQAMFLACAVFYCLIHSLLEEYYWRWFVYREARTHWSLPVSIAISSLGFMAHHVFVLAEFFHWNSRYTYLLSLAVAIGGVFWAWLYERYGTLLGPWLSHLVIDALIFAIAFDLVFHS